MRPWAFARYDLIKNIIFFPDKRRFETYSTKDDPEQMGEPEVEVIPEISKDSVLLYQFAKEAMGFSDTTTDEALRSLGYID